MTCHIELFTLVHYKESIAPDPELSALYKDVLLHHFKEESQHAVIDELEWRREDARLTAMERDRGVSDLITLVTALDGVLRVQAAADGEYFHSVVNRPFTSDEKAAHAAAFLAAYRHQHIATGIQRTRFVEILGELIDRTQWRRIEAALSPLL